MHPNANYIVAKLWKTLGKLIFNHYWDWPISCFRVPEHWLKHVSWLLPIGHCFPLLPAGRDQRGRPRVLPLPRLPRLLDAAHLPPQPAPSPPPAAAAAVGAADAAALVVGPLDGLGALDGGLTGGDGRGRRRGQGRRDRGGVVALVDGGDGGEPRGVSDPAAAGFDPENRVKSCCIRVRHLETDCKGTVTQRKPCRRPYLEYDRHPLINYTAC